MKDSSSLTEDQLSIQKLAFDFAKQKLEPFSIEWDKKHHFPIDVIKEAANSGFGGIYVSPDFGGCGLKRLDASLIFEALSSGDVPVAAFLSIHNMCAWILDECQNLIFPYYIFQKVWECRPKKRMAHPTDLNGKVGFILFNRTE